ncbi:MAG TPA: hypothetical protein VL574_08635 [Stellaceae bacterium]|jgi:hypothetical protein|nr:hypothetical protein [Stellaceae bacterium]
MAQTKITAAHAKDPRESADSDSRQVARTSFTIGLCLLMLSMTPIVGLIIDLVLLMVPTMESAVALPRPDLQGYIVLFCVLTGSVGAAMMFGAGEDGLIQRSRHPGRMTAMASLYGLAFACLLIGMLIWIGSLHFDRAVI